MGLKLQICKAKVYIPFNFWLVDEAYQQFFRFYNIWFFHIRKMKMKNEICFQNNPLILQIKEAARDLRLFDIPWPENQESLKLVDAEQALVQVFEKLEQKRQHLTSLYADLLKVKEQKVYKIDTGMTQLYSILLPILDYFSTPDDFLIWLKYVHRPVLPWCDEIEFRSKKCKNLQKDEDLAAKLNLDPICQRRSPNYVPTEQELDECNYEFRERQDDYQKRLQIWLDKRQKIERIMDRLGRRVENMSSFMQQMLSNGEGEEPELGDLIMEALEAEFAQLCKFFANLKELGGRGRGRSFTVHLLEFFSSVQIFFHLRF